MSDVAPILRHAIHQLTPCFVGRFMHHGTSPSTVRHSFYLDRTSHNAFRHLIHRRRPRPLSAIFMHPSLWYLVGSHPWSETPFTLNIHLLTFQPPQCILVHPIESQPTVQKQKKPRKPIYITPRTGIPLLRSTTQLFPFSFRRCALLASHSALSSHASTSTTMIFLSV